MDDLTMTRNHRMTGYRAYGKAVDALDPVAWRPPPTRRFDSRPANDRPWAAGSSNTEEASRGSLDRLPMWVVVAGGGLVAAAMGAVMGGLLAL